MDAKSLQVCPDDSTGVLSELLREAPVLPYATTTLVGVWLGLHGAQMPTAPWLRILLWSLAAVALAALLRIGLHRLGVLTLACVLGLGCGIAGREPDLSQFDLEGPVEVEGRVAAHPRGTVGEEWLWLRIDRVTQKQWTVRGAFDALVGLPGGELPEGVGPPVWGQTVRLKGYLKISPVLENGAPTRPGPWRMNLASWRFWQVTSDAPAWKRVATRLRRHVERQLSAARPHARGALLRHALLLGSPDRLPGGLRRGLRATGLSHLLAVSGLHVGLLAGWLWLVSMPLGRRARLLVALMGVTVYLLLVGPKPSAVRAAGMAGIVGLSLCFQRPPQALNAAAVWATVLALWRPTLLEDLGFQLSVAATVGILALGPPVGTSLEDLASWVGVRGRILRLLCQALGVSLAAQLATLPFLAPWTALVHPAAPLWNLLAIPWLTIFLGACFLSLPLLWMAPSLDPWVVSALDLLSMPLYRISEAAPSLWTTLPISVSWSGSVVLVGATFSCLLRPRWALRCAFVVVLLGVPGTGHVSRAENASGPLEFLRLDVGQGDALLLRDGSQAVLVDGGGWRRGDIAARVLVPALAHHGVRKLDAVALTHPDSDHCGGLLDLSSYLVIGEIWASPGWEDDCASRLLSRSGPGWRVIWRGDQAAVGRWKVEVLWPPAAWRAGQANDRSLVLHVEGGRQRILLAADLGSDGERHLLRRTDSGELLASVLGVGHHGSKTSTSAAFLDAVSPRLATIGVGERNAYGHPHPTVVERLDRAGVRIHRTDVMGGLRLRLDPSRLHLQEREPPRMDSMGAMNE